MVMVFVLSQDYWLPIKKFQLELAFSKKELEERFELPVYGKDRKAAGFQKHGSQRIYGHQYSVFTSDLCFSRALYSNIVAKVPGFHNL